ncbi:FHA domain-containing protein [Pedobacter sp. L105]|uniref:FHA domain-containing protein n=1 Tax=Pedobacter sp. L105 TaxID=1641871 RepID=UPI00131B2777|nr:FHA domain-containing protein [Pedobacter sp. L105]
MFDFFKKNTENNNQDAKGLRDSILQLVKEELQKLDGAEGYALSVMELYVDAGADEHFLYQTALYTTTPEKLKEEVQRIADNFALDLPKGWALEVLFTDQLPENALRRKGLKAGLIFKAKTAKASVTAERTDSQARITVIKGRAEEEQYMLDPRQGRINIGRENHIQANDGSFRINTIAFPDDEHNKFISRQHAHIEWDEKSGSYKLYADEGGVPPGNKTKIRTAKDESMFKLNSTQIGYSLSKGDQIVLGDVIVLEFNLF